MFLLLWSNHLFRRFSLVEMFFLFFFNMFSFQNLEKSKKMDEHEEFWRKQVVWTNITTKIKTSFWGVKVYLKKKCSFVFFCLGTLCLNISDRKKYINFEGNKGKTKQNKKSGTGLSMGKLGSYWSFSKNGCVSKNPVNA